MIFLDADEMVALQILVDQGPQEALSLTIKVMKSNPHLKKFQTYGATRIELSRKKGHVKGGDTIHITDLGREALVHGLSRSGDNLLRIIDEVVRVAYEDAELLDWPLERESFVANLPDLGVAPDWAVYRAIQAKALDTDGEFLYPPCGGKS